MADLLNDAIVDAQKMIAAVTANAKITLEETFQPTLRNMISAKLSEEDGDDLDIDINYGSDEEPEGDEGEEDGVGFDSFSDDEQPEGEEGDEGEGEEPDDLEMEALFRELEGDEEMMDEGEEDDWDPTMSEGEEDDWQDPNPEFDSMQEGDEFDDETMEEIVEAILAEEEGLGDDLDMGPNKEDGSVYDENPPSGPQFTEVRRLRREHANLKKKYNEALRAITKYKHTMNEVNLLNAKLMYTTKTLRQFSLNENQQVRILESFDRAQTVREVKLVYTTIVESFNKKALKRVNEGLASKSVRAVNPKKRLNEGRDIVDNSTVNRFQELAGIKKINY